MGKSKGGFSKTVKKSALKGQDKDEMMGMFNKMLGTERPDYNIILPKYKVLIEKLNSVVKLLNKFSSCNIAEKCVDFKSHFLQLKNYAGSIKTLLAELEIPPKPDDLEEWKKSVELTVDNYLKLKNHQIIKQLIIIGGRLKKQKKYLGNKSKLSHKFIVTSPEPDVLLFEGICNLPFKLLFLDDRFKQLKSSKDYTLLMLHLLYGHIFEISNTITSPDVDVDKFVEIVSGSIDAIKKQPGLERCGKAFSKIKNATSMLKDNFGGYYRGFVLSGNPSGIMEEFVSDVAQTVDGDIQMVSQFKKIIAFYRKQSSAQMKNNPQLKKVFSMVESQMSALSAMGGGKGDDNDDDEESASDVEESASDEEESVSDVSEEEESASDEKNEDNDENEDAEESDEFVPPRA